MRTKDLEQLAQLVDRSRPRGDSLRSRTDTAENNQGQDRQRDTGGAHEGKLMRDERKTRPDSTKKLGAPDWTHVQI